MKLINVTVVSHQEGVMKMCHGRPIFPQRVFKDAILCSEGCYKVRVQMMRGWGAFVGVNGHLAEAEVEVCWCGMPPFAYSSIGWYWRNRKPVFFFSLFLIHIYSYLLSYFKLKYSRFTVLCVSFWYTTKWVSYTYIFSSDFPLWFYYRLLNLVPCAIQ